MYIGVLTISSRREYTFLFYQKNKEFKRHFNQHYNGLEILYQRKISDDEKKVDQHDVGFVK